MRVRSCRRAAPGWRPRWRFPVVLAEARRWGLSEPEVAQLLPAAERCLRWLDTALGDNGYLARAARAPGSVRAETQAHAHRAALLGGELLRECGRPGADGWLARAGAMRERFRAEFWVDDLGGRPPAAARTADGRPVPLLGSGAAHLLDTGLLGGGRLAPGLLDEAETEQLARLLGGPAMDSGWGLRGLAVKEPGYNPFGHRAGAVRVHESAGRRRGPRGRRATRRRPSPCCGASWTRRRRSVTGCPRCTRGSSAPPGACPCRTRRPVARRRWRRPRASSCLTTLAGIRPDAPAGSVALHPHALRSRSARSGSRALSVAGEPFAVRVSRLGVGMVEQAAEWLQLGGERDLATSGRRDGTKKSPEGARRECLSSGRRL